MTIQKPDNSTKDYHNFLGVVEYNNYVVFVWKYKATVGETRNSDLPSSLFVDPKGKPYPDNHIVEAGVDCYVYSKQDASRYLSYITPHSAMHIYDIDGVLWSFTLKKGKELHDMEENSIINAVKRHLIIARV